MIQSTLTRSVSVASSQSSILRNHSTHALVACWLGAVFDGMDTNNYILTMHPALKELLHTSSDDVIGSYGAGLLALFMVGWAVGAVIFGYMADYHGRAKTLVCTVILCGTATGLCAIVNSWMQLALLRFLVGCGIGGEISIAGVILAELWTGRSRLHAASFLQTGFPVGLFVLAAINLYIGHLGWRWLYAVGMVPALLAIYIRFKLDDPDSFKKVCEYRRSLRGKSKELLSLKQRNALRSPFFDIFLGASLMRSTILVVLAGCTCIGSFAVLSWLPPWINQLVGGTAVAERSYAAISQSLGNLLGVGVAGFTILWLGRKWSFRLAFGGAFVVCMAMFLTSKSFGISVLVWAFLSGVFVFAPYAYLFIYVPELFDTRLRATAFAFCIQTGRLLAAAACLTGGFLVSHIFHGSYALAGATLSTTYLLGLIATIFMPHSDGNVSTDPLA